MKRFVCILLVLLFLFGGATPAKANSAQSYWEGVNSTGIIVNDGDSPIEVKHELLTFDLQDFPKTYYQEETDFLAYSGKVTARYTFYNPSDMTVTATLLFPFLAQPWYGYPSALDAQKYDILIDGQTVEKTIRHTLTEEQFQLENELPLLSDTFVEDSFYRPDLTVTAYKFSISNLNSDAFKYAAVAFDLSESSDKQRFCLENQSSFHKLDNGAYRIAAHAKNGSSFYLYVLGEPLNDMPDFRFYKDGGAEDGEEISGAVNLTHKETTTFEEWACQGWSEDTGVSEIDWYNAVVADLNGNALANNTLIRTLENSDRFAERLMRWYEYEITMEPRQELINTVTAPIYPSINSAYTPSIYGYTYLLSPASTWISFGKLDVIINTPFYMTHCTLNGFEKTETGYKATFDGLPNGELYFELSTLENPEPKSGFNWGWLILIIAPFVLIAEFFESIGEFIVHLFRNLF